MNLSHPSFDLRERFHEMVLALFFAFFLYAMLLGILFHLLYLFKGEVFPLKGAFLLALVFLFMGCLTLLETLFNRWETSRAIYPLALILISFFVFLTLFFIPETFTSFEPHLPYGIVQSLSNLFNLKALT